MLDKKASLREKLKKIRADIDNRDWRNEAITLRLFSFLNRQFPKDKNLNSIFCYQSINSEVNTTEFIKRAQKMGIKILVPEVDKNYNMVAICLKTGLRFYDEPTVTVVPMLGFSDEFHRIGYGKACYDKFFAKHPNTLKIGLAYAEQKCQFDHEPHDISLDCIITG